MKDFLQTVADSKSVLLVQTNIVRVLPTKAANFTLDEYNFLYSNNIINACTSSNKTLTITSPIKRNNNLQLQPPNPEQSSHEPR